MLCTAVYTLPCSPTLRNRFHPNQSDSSERIPIVTHATNENRLHELGITLPKPPKPVASYVPCVQTGSHLIISGQVPFADGKLLMTGALPGAGSIEDAAAAARQCALNALAVARDHLGSLDRISRVLKLTIFVASEPRFPDQPKVANGASDLMVDIFGDAGRHARAAVGCSALPLNTTVEVEVLLEVKD